MKNMKIELYIDNVLKEESIEDGFVILVETKSTSFVKIFSDEQGVVSPYYDKEYLFPNGNLYKIRISTAPVFQKAADMMKQFEGLKYVVLCDGNARLQIIV